MPRHSKFCECPRCTERREAERSRYRRIHWLFPSTAAAAEALTDWSRWDETQAQRIAGLWAEVFRGWPLAPKGAGMANKPARVFANLAGWWWTWHGKRHGPWPTKADAYRNALADTPDGVEIEVADPDFRENCA